MLKKVLLICTMVVTGPLLAFSLSIDGTQTQGKGTFALAVGSEYIARKDIVVKRNTTNNSFVSSKIKDLYRVYLRPSFGIVDGIDIYGKFGITDYIGGERKNGVKQTWKAKQAFLSGAGIKASYEISEGLIWGADLSFSYSENRVNYETLPQNWRMSEWHFAPYIGKLIGNLVPYVGVKYDDMRIKAHADNGDFYKYRAKHQFGPFLGVDYGIGEKICLNLEARFVSETGISFSANYRF